LWRLLLALGLFFSTKAYADQQKDAFEGYDSAKLAQAVYQETPVVGQWRLTKTWDQLCTSCSRATIERIRNSGFYAAVYVNSNTNEAKLVYRGTEFSQLLQKPRDVAGDLKADIQQTLGFQTDQYNLATQRIAQEARRQYPSVTCAGDSLGGGEAHFGCGAIGARSFATNPAGLNQANLAPLSNSNSLSFRWKGDFASNWAATGVPGSIVEYDRPAGMSNFGAHASDAILGSMLKDATAYEHRMLTKGDDDPQYQPPPAGMNTAKYTPCVDYYALGPSKCDVANDDAKKDDDLASGGDFGGKWRSSDTTCSTPIIISPAGISGPGFGGFSSGAYGANCSSAPVRAVQYPNRFQTQLVCSGNIANPMALPMDYHLNQLDADHLRLRMCISGNCTDSQLTRCP